MCQHLSVSELINLESRQNREQLHFALQPPLFYLRGMNARAASPNRKSAFDLNNKIQLVCHR
jgi:hypothetical protein